jgi:hypothetical protein
MAPVMWPAAKRGRYSSFMVSSANAFTVSAMPWRPKMFMMLASARLTISIAAV